MNAQDALAELSSIPRAGDEPVFAEPWEARAFALAVSLHAAGLFTWPQWAARLAVELNNNTEAGGAQSYYQVWLTTLELAMYEHKVADACEVTARGAEWAAAAARTPHGLPIEL